MSKKIRAITISGEVGSGKSTISACLLNSLPNWKYINTGQRFRDFCAAKGMSIQQVSHIPDDIHREFDQAQTKMLEEESNIIVEGRLAGWLAFKIDDVFKVYCDAPLKVRAERYMQRHATSYEQALADIDYRDSKDRQKFEKVYGVEDYREHHFYDLILDTSASTPPELAEAILAEANLIVTR
jgi:cytidylate kinase